MSDYSLFDNMSTQRLAEILRQDFAADNGKSDSDMIYHILEILEMRKKSENEQTKTTTDKWQRFTDEYLPYAESGIADEDEIIKESTIEIENPGSEDDKAENKKTESRSGRRCTKVLKWAAGMAASIAALLLAGTVTASAFGYNIWTVFATWTDESFVLSAKQEPAIEDIYLGLEPEVADVLREYGVTERIFPKWLPEGYVFEHINVTELEEDVFINIRYMRGEEQIISVINIQSKLGGPSYEKDSGEVTVYTINDLDYYIMTNLEHRTIAWQNSKYNCGISGHFSLDEAEEMIGSIYE